MKTNLPFIALRIREHLLHAWVCRTTHSVVLVDLGHSVAHVRTWSEARRLLGYSL